MTDTARDAATPSPSSTGTGTDTRAATGAHTTNGVPHGSTSLTPFIAVPRAAEAIRFYEGVFGARVVDVTEMGGTVVHAELDLGNGHLQLGEPVPDYHLVAPPEGEDDCYSLGLYCPDVDAVVERALAAGATLREPATDFVSGDRYASLRDPFGVRWSVMTRVEDLSEQESARRVAEWAAEAQKQAEHAQQQG
ncbi:VOC family protein [Intrasporangium sp. YIM S08009]|uniref:VOC family protein n=1 Tax=Intrasporangium zincisolvens TaxID=3080018 RepID=UPI002B05C537|nr:VOC family protein [Intrasporangium sp. YIM S08009]